MRPAFSKILFVFVSVFALICLSKPALARHNGGSKGGGGSHGGKSHGGGSFHGGGRSKGASFKAPRFKGGGHSFTSGGSRGGNARVSSARMGGGSRNSGRVGGDSYARSAGFSSRPTGNFARSSSLGGGSFASSTSSRNFERFGGSQSVTGGSRGTFGNWRSFGNSSGRPVLASARTSGNAMGGGWRPAGNTFGHDGGAAVSRGYGSSVRADGQWRSFGNSRNTSFDRNVSGFSAFNAARATRGSNTRLGGFGLGSNGFSPNSPVLARGSSFWSFSSGLSTANFGGSRFGGSGFGNSTLGGSGIFNAGIGSGLSLFPNLLGGFLNVGTSLFGGPGVLAANALSLAVRLFVSGIEANGTGQGDFSGGDASYGQAGFGGNFGMQAASAGAPTCAPGEPAFAPGAASGGFCQPYVYQPFGWGSVGNFGPARVGFNYRW